MKRRNFIKAASLTGAGVLLSRCIGATDPIISEAPHNEQPIIKNKPIIISTWNHGIAANKAAWEKLESGGSALDAVEAGVRVTESDASNRSVGLGGLPDRDGNVTLDACIMNHESECGAVAYLQNIENPISVARKVMEDTPHVMLSGKGALDFAISKGYKKENLLTDDSKKDWLNWKEKSNYKPVINIENHDTISMLLIDDVGDLYGACTTSGAAWKMHGRVGDSPIIGAGLFLDNEVGAAAATGLGEAIIKTSGSAMVVELMRQGASPLEACKTIVKRISKIHKSGPEWDYLQVGFIAINKNGEYAGYSLRKGFNYSLCDEKNKDLLIDAKYEIG